MLSSNTFRLGADPELFLMNREGKILSAIGKLGGTKEAPIPVVSMGPGFAYQEDNVLVEYNIPPSNSDEAFRRNNQAMMKYLNRKVETELEGCSLKVQASHIMDDDQLEDPRAHVFGCEPDFNVWTLQPNPRPLSKNKSLRSAGGHIHVGIPNLGRIDKVMIGRLMDSTLGLWSVIKDSDTRRRELYGKAGSIRFKPYGLEYRTLSNFWLRGDEYMSDVWGWVEVCIAAWKDKKFSAIEKLGNDIQEAINKSDKKAADELLTACRT
jgi:hypothetical protein